MKLHQLSYDEVFTYKHLFESFKKCLKGVKWKGTVQNYNQHAISMVYRTYMALKQRNVKTGNFFHFTIMERGKVRQIKSVSIYERVIQRCFCDYCLVPVLSSKFIYDNSACIKGKGMHFALKRFKHNLHNYYIKYKNYDGYIVQFDFHKFFDSINHKMIIDMINKQIVDNDLHNLFAQLVNDFGSEQGLGLGSQISQISALYFPHIIDDTFANDQEVFAYARYMDDGYIIVSNKIKVRECLNKLHKLTQVLCISLNSNKTQIQKLNRPLEFLKARIKLYKNGRIVMKPNRKNITRNRKKLKKLFKCLYEEGKITNEDVYNVFKTTYGNFSSFNAYKTKQNYKCCYNSLFGG